jgi:predicted ester cyclase
MVVRRLLDEVWGLGAIELIPELIAEEYVGHLAIGDHYGPEGVRIEVSDYRRAFPDLSISIDHLIAEDDVVVRRFTLRGTHCHSLLGSQPSGGVRTLHGIAIDRLEDGLIVESWVQIDPIPP